MCDLPLRRTGHDAPRSDTIVLYSPYGDGCSRGGSRVQGASGSFSGPGIVDSWFRVGALLFGRTTYELAVEDGREVVV